jgi:hypothetical protein
LTMLSSFTPTNFMDCMGMFFAMVVPIAPAWHIIIWQFYYPTKSYFATWLKIQEKWDFQATYEHIIFPQTQWWSQYFTMGMRNLEVVFGPHTLKYTTMKINRNIINTTKIVSKS